MISHYSVRQLFSGGDKTLSLQYSMQKRANLPNRYTAL